MSDRNKLVADFIRSARALAAEGMSGLNAKKAVLVAGALERGADIVIVFNTSSSTVIGAIHFPDPGADPAELFRIVVPSPEGVTN